MTEFGQGALNLQKRLASALEDLRLSNSELDAYKQEAQYLQTLLSNPQLTPRQKLVLLIIRSTLRSVCEDHIQLTEATTLNIARAISLKPAKVIKCIKELEEEGYIERKTSWGPVGNGNRATTSIKLSGVVGMLNKIRQEKSFSCPRCDGSEQLEVRKVLFCDKCGYSRIYPKYS